MGERGEGGSERREGLSEEGREQGRKRATEGGKRQGRYPEAGTGQYTVYTQTIPQCNPALETGIRNGK